MELMLVWIASLLIICMLSPEQAITGRNLRKLDLDGSMGWRLGFQRVVNESKDEDADTFYQERNEMEDEFKDDGEDIEEKVESGMEQKASAGDETMVREATEGTSREDKQETEEHEAREGGKEDTSEEETREDTENTFKEDKEDTETRLPNAETKIGAMDDMATKEENPKETSPQDDVTDWGGGDDDDEYGYGKFFQDFSDPASKFQETASKVALSAGEETTVREATEGASGEDKHETEERKAREGDKEDTFEEETREVTENTSKEDKEDTEIGLLSAETKVGAIDDMATKEETLKETSPQDDVTDWGGGDDDNDYGYGKLFQDFSGLDSKFQETASKVALSAREETTVREATEGASREDKHETEERKAREGDKEDTFEEETREVTENTSKEDKEDTEIGLLSAETKVGAMDDMATKEETPKETSPQDDATDGGGGDDDNDYGYGKLFQDFSGLDSKFQETASKVAVSAGEEIWVREAAEGTSREDKQETEESEATEGDKEDTSEEQTRDDTENTFKEDKEDTETRFLSAGTKVGTMDYMATKEGNPKETSPEDDATDGRGGDDGDDYGYGTVFQDLSDLASKFQETASKVAAHVGPDIQNIADNSKLYFDRANRHLSESFSPLVGARGAPLIASIISYGLVLLPFVLVVILFERIRAILSLEKVLLCFHIYLSAYFAILMLATFILGSEPMVFFYKSSARGFINLQLLQELVYIVYFILQTFNATRAYSPEPLGVRLMVVFQWLVAAMVGLHYSVTVFYRDLVEKVPHASWQVYALYSFLFAVLCFFCKLKWTKKEYSHSGVTDPNKKS